MTVKPRFVSLAAALLLIIPVIRPAIAVGQEPAPTGSIAGRVVDEEGTAVAGAQIYLERPALGTQTRSNGEYVLTRVPPGSYTLHARLLGYRPETANVTVSGIRERPFRVASASVLKLPATERMNG